MVNNLDERTKTDFLVYANSVIKSRAIPFVEDNLKPVHRRILYTLWLDKLYPDKKTKKCATEVGRTMALNPHGDAAIYGALIRLSQPWKLRYPLIYLQGSNGNLLGDPFAASRYTECRLSPIGMLMLDDIDKNAVEFKPNYDETVDEPIVLPSRFPYLLCGNNSGIAVGMSSDLVSHNYNEVADGIKYYLDHKDCSIADLMKYIKGPDFPTKGKILNGEELEQIYTSGQGAVRVQAHYDIHKQNNGKTLLVFHDIPYGVEITSGVLAPLKKLVLEEGYEAFEDFYAECTNPDMQYYDIFITLAKGADVLKCLSILFSKTRLEDSIKINQTVIIDGEPHLLNLKQLISYWVNFRSDIIVRISKDNYEKTNHKLTVTLGLKKCMSDIDLLISLIRNSESRADAKVKIMKEFVLNDEQADAVLDMKLSKLSRLDLVALDEDEKKYRNTLADLKNIIDNENVRYELIKRDLDEMRKIIGADERLTEISYRHPVISNGEVIEIKSKEEWFVCSDGVISAKDQTTLSGVKTPSDTLRNIVYAYNRDDIVVFTADGEMCPIGKMPLSSNWKIFKGFANSQKKKIVSVTKNGNIKVTNASEYRLNKVEKVMKLKEDDSLIMIDMVSDEDFIILYDGQDHILKLAVKDLPVASKLTVGVKSGFSVVENAFAATDSDFILTGTSDNKCKYTSVKDFNVDSRGNKGQQLTEDTKFVTNFDNSRDAVYVFPKQGKAFTVPKNKLSVKSRTATGASITTRAIVNIL